MKKIKCKLVIFDILVCDGLRRFEESESAQANIRTKIYKKRASKGEASWKRLSYFRILHTFLIVFAPPDITNTMIFCHYISYHEVLKIMHFGYPARYYPNGFSQW